MRRRHFMKAVSGAVPATYLTSCARPGGLDHPGLGAVVHTILPTEIGNDAHRRIAEAFRAWANGIEVGAELNHGYGTGELGFVTEDPVPRWQGQLDSLDREAHAHHGAGLEFINDQQRMQLVREALAPLDLSRLPNPRTADHVAVAVLAFFYRSPQATDLAYRAAIRKQQCRPLSDSPRPPISLGGDA